MSDKEITDQTAFEVAGIPTPPDQQDVTPTDMVSEVVAEIMDSLPDGVAAQPSENRNKHRK